MEKQYFAFDMSNGKTYIGFLDEKEQDNTIYKILTNVVVVPTVDHSTLASAPAMYIELYNKVLMHYNHTLDYGQHSVSHFEQKCVMRWYLGSNISENRE